MFQLLKHYFFIIAIMLCLPPFGGAVYLLLDYTNEDIEFSEKERVGVRYHQALFNLFLNGQEFRGTTYVSAHNNQNTKLANLKKTLVADIEAVDRLETDAHILAISHEWRDAKNELLSMFEENSLETPRERFARHTKSLTPILLLMQKVGNQSNLILDPQLEPYYMMNIIVNLTPEIVWNLGLIRGTLAGTIAANEDVASESNTILEIKGKLSYLGEQYHNSITVISENDPENVSNTVENRIQASEKMKASIELATNIISRKTDDITYETVFSSLSQTISAFHDGYISFAEHLDWHLSERINQYKTYRMNMLLALGIGLSIALFGLIHARRDVLRQKARAERANHSKSEFLANMTHELRTPLNSVIGMTNLLLDRPLGQEEKGMLDIVSRSSQLLLDHVNDILDISKIEAGETTFECIGFDAESAISRVIHVQKPVAERKGVSLTCTFEQSFPFLLGDPLRLGQIVANLVSNAIKYTDEGSVTVLISHRMVGNNKLELLGRVTDTGIGIPKSKLNSIFKKFTQVDSSDTRRYGGTGLGLAIVKNLIQMMHGDIGVESSRGKGTTFWFVIPFAITSELGGDTVRKRRNQIVKVHGAIPAENAKILVAEDHPLNQAFIKILLPKYGLRNFDIRETGRQILSALEQKQYDLILMDCFMPDLNGFETTKIIRQSEQNSSKHIPIVALTANAMTGDREKCIAAGMDDYLAKPISEPDFIAVISRWIDLDERADKPTKKQPVDSNVLGALTGGDLEIEKQLLGLFIAKSDENLATLSSCCVDGHSQEWVEAAHMFKGGAAGIGAEALRTLCSEAQELSHAAADVRSKLLARIRSEYEIVTEYLRRNNLKN